MHEHGLDALLVTPGPNLRYLTGYHALDLERITCLIVRPDHEPVLVVPLLEKPAAVHAGIDFPILTWEETDDSIGLVINQIGTTATRIGVDDHLWSSRLLALQTRMSGREFLAAGAVISTWRMRKSPAELAALREAGRLIDAVHAEVPNLLAVGRTEAEVGADIARLIVDVGHVAADFVIVGSGPNGASPHHEVSDRVIQSGETVVVDIGGPTPQGYFSDSTRTYVMGTPSDEIAQTYAHLQAAQQAQLDHIRPGVTAESVDAVGREYLASHGLDRFFIHRTGHGIGQEVHEDPYIVSGNDLVLEESMTFSIEPGVYFDGKWGARIEDIVAVTADGMENFNNRPRELTIVN